MDHLSPLPEELAMTLLDYLVLQPDLIFVSHVSRRWRGLVKAHPAFWRTIQLRDPQIIAEIRIPQIERVQAQLLASTCTGLTVDLDLWRTLAPDPVPDASQLEFLRQQVGALSVTLTQNMCRVATLKMVVNHEIAGSLESGGVFKADSPLLERLDIEICDQQDELTEDVLFDWKILHCSPQLSALRLIRVPIISLHELSTHSMLEEFAWWPYPAIKVPTQLTRLDHFLDQLPRLRSLELLGSPVTVEAGNIDDVFLRLTRLKYFGLDNSILRELEITQLKHVPRIRVRNPSISTVQNLLAHFCDVTSSSIEPPGLHFDLWPFESTRVAQPMVVSELSSSSRARVLDFHSYLWLPHVPAMEDLANRVTRLSVPATEWDELIEALRSAKALTELVLRVTDDADAEMNLHAGRRLASCHQLRSLTLQAAQKAYERGRLVLTSASTFCDFVHHAIDPTAHRKMRLICDMVQWATSIPEGSPSPSELLESYFISVEEITE